MLRRPHNSLHEVHNHTVRPQVEAGALVAAGSVVQPHTTVGAGQVWGGNPARFIRELKPHEASFMHKSADAYCSLGAEHFEGSKAAAAHTT